MLKINLFGKRSKMTLCYLKNLNFFLMFAGRVFETPGLDFINILRTAFTPVVPQSVRTQSSRQYLLGPTSVKAVRRTLMKLTPDVNEWQDL